MKAFFFRKYSLLNELPILSVFKISIQVFFFFFLSQDSSKWICDLYLQLNVKVKLSYYTILSKILIVYMSFKNIFAELSLMDN